MGYLKYIALGVGSLAIGWIVGYMIAKRAADAALKTQLAAQKKYYDGLMLGTMTSTTTPAGQPPPSLHPITTTTAQTQGA